MRQKHAGALFSSLMMNSANISPPSNPTLPMHMLVSSISLEMQVAISSWSLSQIKSSTITAPQGYPSRFIKSTWQTQDLSIPYFCPSRHRGPPKEGKTRVKHKCQCVPFLMNKSQVDDIVPAHNGSPLTLGPPNTFVPAITPAPPPAIPPTTEDECKIFSFVFIWLVFPWLASWFSVLLFLVLDLWWLSLLIIVQSNLFLSSNANHQIRSPHTPIICFHPMLILLSATVVFMLFCFFFLFFFLHPCSSLSFIILCYLY